MGEIMEPRTDHDGISGRRPRERGDHQLNRMFEAIVHTMTAMEAGRCPIQTLDTIASPFASRRIHKQVKAARAKRLAAGSSGSPVRTEPIRILSTASMYPTAGVAEGVVVVAIADRARAFCVRVEQEARLWRVVDLASPETDLRAAITEASRNGSVPTDEDGIRRSSGGVGTAFAMPPLPDDLTLPIEDGDQETDESD
jgi:hypothetical protein